MLGERESELVLMQINDMSNYTFCVHFCMHISDHSMCHYTPVIGADEDHLGAFLGINTKAHLSHQVTEMSCIH